MSKKILIVDDELDMITFISEILEDSGYTSISAKDGEEGQQRQWGHRSAPLRLPPGG